MMTRWKLGLGVIAAMGLSACEVTIEPLIGDFQLTGTWTIDGAVPNATSCSNVGISKVRLVPTTPNDNLPTMEGNCADGFLLTGLFDVDYGTYSLRWEAVSSTGMVVAMADVPSFTVSSPTSLYTVAPFALTTTPPGATVSGTWTVNGGAADATTCAAAGISTVRMVPVSMPSGAVIPSLSFACSAGAFDTAPTTIPYGTYQFRWEALDASNNVIDSQMNPDLVLTNQVSATVMPFAIEYTPTSLTINLTYEDGVSSGSYGLCEMVPTLSKLYYRLWKQSAEGEYVTGAVDIDNHLGTSIGCTNSIIFTPPNVSLEPGFYSFYAEASYTDGGTEHKVWVMESGDNPHDIEITEGEMSLVNLTLVRQSL